MPRSKFNVSTDKSERTLDGIVFDSALEMRYYREVVMPLLESDTVVAFERQKPFVLQETFEHNGQHIKEITYVADFSFTMNDGIEHVVDIKGYADSTAQLKRKLFWYRYPDIDYRWLTYSPIDGGWVDYDTVKKNRAKRKRERQRNEKG